jgi:ubiquinone/menaquinone biosynthesis C-methylase UbiE/uncharacterized protein YbaR (Trm112 family)
MRNGNLLNNIDHDQLLDEDDIKTGVIVAESSNTAYPIANYVGVMLSDADVDRGHHNILLSPLKDNVPASYNAAIQSTLGRIYGLNETDDGKWNREEMKYYDEAVSTPARQQAMLKSIQEENLWRIFIPRKKDMIDLIANAAKGQWLLEIGCGNSRTITRIFHPGQNGYNYLGTDISFKRLEVAKQALPGSDFLQASALNLPLKKDTFNVAISFGMLHHLPRPSEAIIEVNKTLKPGGYFTFHEPVYTSRKFSEKQSAVVRKIFRTYEHSDHDNKIELKEAMDCLKSLHHTIISIVPYNSIFRVMFEGVMNLISKKWLTRKTPVSLLLKTDNVLLRTIVKLSNKMGPQAAVVVSQKK